MAIRVGRIGVLALVVSFGQDVPSARLEELAWIAGHWEGTHGKTRIEEHWLPPAAGVMLGIARMVSGERLVNWEFLRIEERSDGIYYVAHPKARPGTDFKLTRLSEREAVFENPRHDHPKMITYRLERDGSLVARIEGDEKGKRAPQEFRFQRKPRR